MKSFAIACLAAVSTNAVALESDYTHPWLEVEDDEVLVPDLERLVECVFYCRIVSVHKLPLDKLNCQGTFAY